MSNILPNQDERFWNKVRGPDLCQPFSGAINQCGYGWIARRGTQMHAHRWAWILMFGTIPKGMHVLHKCDNPRCCNIHHLYLGSHEENMRDMALRERAAQLKFSTKQIQLMRKLSEAGIAMKALSKRFKISESYLQAVLAKRARVYS